MRRVVHMLTLAPVRLVWRLLLWLIVIFGIPLLMLYGALWYQPQSMTSLLRSAVAIVGNAIPDSEIALGSSEFAVAHVGAPVHAKLGDIRVVQHGQLVLDIPAIEADFGLSLWPFPRFSVRHLVVSAPVFYPYATVQTRAAATASATPTAVDYREWKRAARRLNRMIAFEEAEIRNGRVALTATGSDTVAPTAQFATYLTLQDNQLAGWLELSLPPVDAAHPTPRLRLDAIADPSDTSAQLTGSIEALRPSTLGFLPIPEWLLGLDSEMQGTISGTIVGINDAEATVKIDTHNGRYAWPALFAAPVPISSLKLTTDVHWRKGDLKTTHRVMLELPETTINAHMAFDRNTHGTAALRGTASLKELPTNALAGYWPLLLAPATREWAAPNIKEGVLHTANLTLNIGDETLRGGTLKTDELAADFTLEGVQVTYLPTHQPIKDIRGALKLTGTTLNLTFDEAKALSGSTLRNGVVIIPDFNEPETRLTAEFDAETTASDVVRLLATPEINLAKPLGLSSFQAKGTGVGHVKLESVIFSSLPNPTPEYYADQFKYEIIGDTKKAGQDKLFGDTDISNADLHVEAKTDGLTIDGSMDLFGVPATLDLAQTSAKGTSTKVAFLLPAEKIAAFGYPPIPGLAGDLGIKATILEKKGKKSTAMDVLLDNAVLDIPAAGLHKDAGVPAQLKLQQIKQPNGTTELNQLSYVSADAQFGGEAVLARDGSIRTLHLPNVKSGKQQASIHYDDTPTGAVLRIKGSSLDMVPWRKMQEEAKKNAPKKAGNPLDPGALEADIQLDTIWLEAETPISDFKATISCTSIRCESANIRGNLPPATDKKSKGGDFSIRILREDGKRQLRIQSSDAGQFLKSLDAMTNLRGGTLLFDGTYQDNGATAGPLVGKLKIDDFFAKEAPLITKILSLTSPLGIVNALMGSGIEFTTARANITATDGTIGFKGAKMSGSALGFTADGTLQLGSEELVLQGTVIPAYMLNSVVGQIPVLGDILVGGKGQGLIATRFSVKGTYEDPNITVNPLSMLTPGFLRGVFDAFTPADGKTPPNDKAAPTTNDPRGASKNRPSINDQGKKAGASEK